MADVPTDRQLDVLREIFASVEQRGFPPTIVELCIALGLSQKSKHAIWEHLEQLEAKKLIEHEPKKSRALRITERGLSFLTGRAA